jgi:outer membrane protein TolC
MAAGIGVVLCTGFPRAASAQDRITLDEAMAIARRSNPTYQQAAVALDLNSVESRATWANQVLPTVDLNLLRTGFGGNRIRQSTDFFGNPVENPITDWVYNSSTSQGLTLNWTIRGTSIFDAAARQSRTNLDRSLGLRTAAWTLESEVRRRFYDALEQQALLEVEESIGEARRVDLESARRLFEIAQRSRVDVLNAELQVEQQELNTREQVSRYEQAVLALRTYMGDPDMADFELAAIDPPVFDPAGLEVGTLVALAMRENPTLMEAESSVAGARLGVREARQSWYPNLNLAFDYGRLAQTREAEAFLDFTPQSAEWQSSFSVFISLPVLNNFFGDRAEQARAQVEVDRQELALRDRRLQVEETVRTQLITLRNQFQSLSLAQRSLEIAGEAVALAREEYRLGTRTFEQLQEAVTQLADARRQVIQTRYTFVDALLTLEEAVGQRVAPGSN